MCARVFSTSVRVHRACLTFSSRRIRVFTHPAWCTGVPYVSNSVCMTVTVRFYIDHNLPDNDIFSTTKHAIIKGCFVPSRSRIQSCQCLYGSFSFKDRYHVVNSASSRSDLYAKDAKTIAFLGILAVVQKSPLSYQT